MENKLKMAVVEVVGNFDPEKVILPLEDPETIFFEEAVHNLAFAKLMPDLPVNNQSKSEPEDIQTIKERAAFYANIALEMQKKITGFSLKEKMSRFTSALL